MNASYALGVAVGMFSVVIVILVMRKFARNKLKVGKGVYDERQMRIRGKAYQYSFLTVMGLIALELAAESVELFEHTIFTSQLATFFILMVGVVTYALTCIHKDAYLGVGDDGNNYMRLLYLVIVFQLANLIMCIKEGMIEDGKLLFGAGASIMFIIGFGMIIIAMKRSAIRQKKAAIEEDLEDDLDDELEEEAEK